MRCAEGNTTVATSAPEQQSYRERLYQDYFANLHPDAADARARLRLAAPYLKSLMKQLPGAKDAHILDLGCGYGPWLYWLREAGYQRLEGVDGSAEQVEMAHRLGLDFVRQGDILHDLAERPPASCDVVLAFDVIEHLGKQEALQLADGVFRLLRPDGLFILHLPNGGGIFSGHVVYGDITHETTYTAHSLEQLLRCAGFSGVSAYEDAPIVHGVASLARLIVWKAAKAVLRVVFAAQTGDYRNNVIMSQGFLAVARK